MTERAASKIGVSTYAQIAEKVNGVRRLFVRRGISLHLQSVLSQIFGKAETLAKDFEAQLTVEEGAERLVAMMHANRIADAILGVADEEAARECLIRIAKKDMDLGIRAASQGKDALWELELLAMLRSRGARAWLQEPDIAVALQDGEYPIACKKINSEPGMEDQVRSACNQLRKYGSQGIVALNIDELIPENNILRGESVGLTGRHLQKLAESFLDRHRLVLQKAVSGEKCDAVLISITAMIDIEGLKPRFSYQTETMFWSVTGKNAAGKERLMQLGAIISAPPTIYLP